jgi:GntR family transcriptional repressor for pyruvate dehydrogenase complex
VQSSRLYEDVAEQIEQQILDGSLKPDDKLPPEHTLANEFGVSRTVIREAIQSLRSRGLVQVVQGSGMYVREPEADTFVKALSTLFQFREASPFDLHQVREILEIEIAGLAATESSEEDKAELLKSLAWMEAARDSVREYVELDLLFHGILARATGNEVFLLLLEPLIDYLRQSRLRATQAPGGVERSFQGHRAICQCVVSGDAEGARAAMHEHLQEVRQRLAAVHGEE